MVAICPGIQATYVPVYVLPKLIFMGCMFACLFVCASKYKIRIQPKLGLLRGRCHPPMLASLNACRLLNEAEAVYTLVFEYAPVLFLIGYHLRKCGWSARSRDVAHKVLPHCYIILTHVLYEFRNNVEYLRTVGTTMLVWDKWCDNLTGRCEAFMARFVATMRANRQCKSLDTACDLFVILKAGVLTRKVRIIIAFSGACMNVFLEMCIWLWDVC